MSKSIFSKAIFALLMFTTSALLADDSVNILTFNIRLSTAKDGENSWQNRKDFVVDIIQNKSENGKNYDFIGCQEAVIDPQEELNQVNYITSKCSSYDSIWLSREKTLDRGEAMLLLWNRKRWKIDDSDKGTFWLSDTPEIAGSKNDPKAGCPRCVTFGLFHELKNGKNTGRKIYVANTHYDHQSELARQKSAIQIINWIANRKNKNTPLIFMGDLNCGEKSPTIKYMKGESIKLDNKIHTPPLSLIDTFRAVNPDTTEAGTFHGFKDKTIKDKIDYIFVTENLIPISSKIIRIKRNGHFPSDHFPVETTIKW
jgi:endonuclease/exonuclease/phosphatase family metal-dependent hydrolase